VHFCLDTRAFQQAKYYQTDGAVQYTTLNNTAAFNADIGSHNPAGVLLGFASGASRTLEVRMGISWTSQDKACTYAQAEIPNLSAFDAVKAAARYDPSTDYSFACSTFRTRAKWNKVLGTVQLDTTGVSSDTQTLFWSSLYRTYLSPTNITGDNPLWESTEPYWDSLYCIW
jgi:putative alpha-1,2-mannosidase